MSGALGGLGGAIAGNILYDKFGRPHEAPPQNPGTPYSTHTSDVGPWPSNPQQPAETYDPGAVVGGNWSEDPAAAPAPDSGSTGGDWGAPADDSGNTGGDWGGGDTGGDGGGDWGGGTWTENNYVTSTFFVRVSDNWSVRATHNFNSDTGRLQEQFYTLYRDLRSWTGAVTFRVQDNVGSTTDFTIAFQLSLKASPSSHVGDDVVNRERLVGQ